MKIFISKCVHVVGRLTNVHKMASALTLLLLAVFLMPQKAAAAWDFQEKFMFNGYQYHRARVLSPNGRGGWTPLRPLRGLQESRVATREESGESLASPRDEA